MCQLQNFNNIKNINNPSCKNCIYFQPSVDYEFGKCKLFGNKNIISDKITNNYARDCRNDENKCGIKGKFFNKSDSFSIFIRDLINMINNSNLLLNINTINVCFLIILLIIERFHYYD